MGEENKELLAKNEQTNLTTAPITNEEDDDDEDIIIPRVKVINSLSQERKDKEAEEGDLINSLTKEKLNGLHFIPLFKYKQNIEWHDRSDGGGIKCYSKDGKVGFTSDGQAHNCKECGRNEWDNNQTGRDAIPKCTKYITFFGLIAETMSPITLSFSKTNMKEGKKLYSMIKLSMANFWAYAYPLKSIIKKKNNDEWYCIDVGISKPTTQEQRDYAASVYKAYRTMQFKDATVTEAEEDSGSKVVNVDMSNVEY